MLHPTSTLDRDTSAMADRVTIDRTGRGSYRLLLDGHQIGSATFLAYDDVVHSCGWGVDERWQGQGIMTRVLPLLLADQAAAGIRSVHTVIGEHNTASQRLATRCGFRRTVYLGEPSLYSWSLQLPAPADAAAPEPRDRR